MVTKCDLSRCPEHAYSVVRFPSGQEVPYCIRHVRPHAALVVRVLRGRGGDDGE